MAKQLLFNEDARRKLLSGVEQISKAVKVTLGPCGRMVMLGNPYDSPTITKDGVSVAKDIELKDPFENMGARFVKEVASKTNDDAGDGTTTSTVLAYSLVKEGFKSVASGIAPIAIKRGMDKAVAAAVEEIRKNSKPVKSGDDVINIASISANNDSEIGRLISDAIDKVGKDGVITVEESKNMDTTVEVVEGMNFDKGYISPYLVTDKSRMDIQYNDPLFLIYDKKISSMKDFLPILEKVSREGRPLVVICEDMDGEALTTVVVNTMRGTIQVAVVQAPGFGDNRKEMLQDIATLTGAKVISEDMGIKLSDVALIDLGKAKSVKITKDTTTIIEGLGNSADIEARVKYIKSRIDDDCVTDYDKEKLKERLAKLDGGVAVIKVGANSETELKEKKFRVEDTIAATKAALEEGIVPGGGLALIQAAKVLSELPEDLSSDEAVGYRIVRRALEEPIRQIAENSGVDGSVIAARAKTEKKGVGYNAYTGEWVDMLQAGIIDPVKVTISALRNAVSIAGTLLTTECAITDLVEENKDSNQ